MKLFLVLIRTFLYFMNIQFKNLKVIYILLWNFILLAFKKWNNYYKNLNSRPWHCEEDVNRHPKGFSNMYMSCKVESQDIILSTLF